MDKFLDRLKQRLRHLGRDSVPSPAPHGTAERDGTNRPHIRTELDPAIPAGAVPPAAPRLRQATLSKARKRRLQQPAGTIWGPGPDIGGPVRTIGGCHQCPAAAIGRQRDRRSEGHVARRVASERTPAGCKPLWPTADRAERHRVPRPRHRFPARRARRPVVLGTRHILGIGTTMSTPLFVATSRAGDATLIAVATAPATCSATLAQPTPDDRRVVGGGVGRAAR